MPQVSKHMYVKIDNQAENLAGEKKIADYDAQKVMHISARRDCKISCR
jgi:hypothetical protein